ncbi:DUF2200 domain-containing protein [Streptococcus hyointestinalis]|uniref:DUF2200 domain-containing protein n=1 Tax=Streptococcus hyointestinalis TaxID=1337 RepID=UPI001F1544A6|nr:DUF2200 domain-containing protein [Streptococcus hyointestinalis]
MNVFEMTFARIYEAYVNKVERKQRTREELDEVITWLTGYSEEEIALMCGSQLTMRDFFEQAPAYNTKGDLITGVICGVKVQEVKDPLMKKIRQLDKLVDELAKGKAMDKIKRV